MCYPFFRLRYRIKARFFIIPISLFAPLYNVPRFFEFETVNNVSFACLDHKVHFLNVPNVNESSKIYDLHNDATDLPISSPITLSQENFYTYGLAKNEYPMAGSKTKTSSSVRSNQNVSSKDNRTSLTVTSNFIFKEGQYIKTTKNNVKETDGVRGVTAYISYKLYEIIYN